MFDQNTPPPNGAQYGAIWASPTMPRGDYEGDCKRFATRGSPHVLIRQSCEFHERRQLATGHPIYPPALWVLVVKLSPGFHMIYAFWRGRPFFPIDKNPCHAKISSGAEAYDIATKGQERGGYDQNEWADYLALVQQYG